MADRSEGGSPGYWLQYVLVSAGLLGVTWVVVTRVLPPRLVPNAGFRERAVRFSTEPPTFDLPEPLAVSTASAEPVPAARAPDTAAGPRPGERARPWRYAGWLPDPGRREEACSRLAAYLAEHPDDAVVRPGPARARTLPFPSPVVSDPLVRARRARAAGDAREAAALYRLATDLRPGETPAWLERTRFLATDLQSPRRAVAVLEETLRRRDGASHELERRLARYSAWAGEEERARDLLAGLDRAGEARPGDLALHGDLLRWAGERRRAEELYDRVLDAPAADSSAARRAERGLEELRARDRRVAAARDPRRAAVTATRLEDSDGFARAGLRGEALLGTGSGLGRLVATAGLYRVHGARVPGRESGAEAGVGWIRWMDHATARVEVRAGRELGRPGTGGRNALSADLLLLDRGVDRLGVGLSTRPAHEITQSLASLREGQMATGAGLRLGHAPGDAASLDARIRADVIHGGGTGRSVRLLGTGSWLRSVADGLRLGAAARVLSHASPAFDAGGRPGYWSPALSWTSSAVADWRLGPGAGSGSGTGWGLQARIQPGLSVVREHGAGGVTAGSSVQARGGVLRRWDRATAEAAVRWTRSRAGEYDALAATIGLSWRF